MVPQSASARRTAIGAAWSVALTVILLWPLRHGGYPLGRDMVFGPRQPLNAATFGLGSASPRAVPVDALIGLADRVMGGQFVARLALSLPLIATGAGLARLLSGYRAPSILAAIGIAIWNPYVVERLAIGQWALLWCYAALPWLVIGLRMRPGRARWAVLGVAVGAASITPTGGIIAAAFTLGGLFVCRQRSRGDRRNTWAALTIIVLQLPWVIAAIVSVSSRTSDPAAIDAFSGRAEHDGGVALTLLGGGGIWNAEVVPGSRCGALAFLGLAALAVAAVIGFPVVRRLLGGQLLGWLVVIAVVGLVVALAAAVPGGHAVLRVLIDHVPGAGLLRDAQKWVMPLAFLEAVLVGGAVEHAVRRVRIAAVLPGIIVATMAVPLLLMPDAAATVHATVRPARIPSDWMAVESIFGRGGDLVAVPFGAYRSFEWAPGRPVLDPAPRLLTAPVVVDDRLQVDGVLLQGEDRRASAVGAVLDSGQQIAAPLAALGIEWILVEKGTAGRLPSFDGLIEAYQGSDLALYRVPDAMSGPRPAPGRVVAVIAADVLAGLVGLATLIVGLVEAVRHSRRLLSSSNYLGQGGR